MKAKETYLKGKSVFIVSLIVIGITVLTVYISGVDYNRSITSNFYFSLGIIGACLFLFMNYGLYRGVGLIDNYSGFKGYQIGDTISQAGTFPDLPSLDGGDDIGGMFAAILFWIVMTVVIFILLIVLDAIFWLSFSLILAMLYWVFFRALRLVFNKSEETKGNFGLSTIYAFGYTVLFTGWIFGIVYLTEVMK